MLESLIKLTEGVYSRSNNEFLKTQSKEVTQQRKTLKTFTTMGDILLDKTINNDQKINNIFKYVEESDLNQQVEHASKLLKSKRKFVFDRVVSRHKYIGRYAPIVLSQLDFKPSNKEADDLIDSINIVNELNEENKRKLPSDCPTSFIPKKVKSYVISKSGKIDKQAWETVLVTKVQEEIKAGNISVIGSKMYGEFSDFFISQDRWDSIRNQFFNRANLPTKSGEIKDMFTKRLDSAYKRFFFLRRKMIL